MELRKFTMLLAAVFAVVVAAVSCDKIDKSNPVPAGKIDISLKGDFNDFSTKASIENIFRMTWSDGINNPKVYVYGKESGSSVFSCLGTLEVVPDESTGNRVADLKGTITAPETGTKLSLVYSPILAEAPTVTDGSISIDLASQNGGANEVTFVACSSVDYKGATDATYRAAFSFATSVLHINVCDLSANTELDKATVGQIETGCKLAFSESSEPTITGDDSTGTITREFTSCSSNAKGTAAFYIAVPSITVNNNRKLTIIQKNGYCTEYNGIAADATGAGNILNSIARMEYGLCDLSLGGTANCYIVPGFGNYKFKATVKGNGTESVGTPTTASVLWESFGTDVIPNVGDLVKNVTLSDGYVSFTATDKKGNAVIAVKDGETILWSWHIWLTDAPALQVYNNNAGAMMDRNLGATCATPGDVRALGLIYQWGRKDPFLSGYKIAYSAYVFPQAASTLLSWHSESAADHLSDNNTLDYSIKNPTTVIWNNTSSCDWYSTSFVYRNDTLWRSAKTIYDPCPPGCRVPDGGDSGVWSKAFNSPSWVTESNWNDTSRGMDFGSTDVKLGPGAIWYPAAGHREYGAGMLYNVGNSGMCWSCTPNVTILSGACPSYCLTFGDIGSVYPSAYDGRSVGGSVRCLFE